MTTKHHRQITTGKPDCRVANGSFHQDFGGAEVKFWFATNQPMCTCGRHKVGAAFIPNAHVISACRCAINVLAKKSQVCSCHTLWSGR